MSKKRDLKQKEKAEKNKNNKQKKLKILENKINKQVGFRTMSLFDIRLCSEEVDDLMYYMKEIKENGTYLHMQMKPRGRILEVLFRAGLMEEEKVRKNKKSYSFIDDAVKE